MKIDTVKKELGSYLHSYGSNRDVQILALPLMEAKKIFKYMLLICQTKGLGKENSDFETIF